MSIVGIVGIVDGNNDYPHVLHNVVPKRELPTVTQNKIRAYFPELSSITEYGVASQIFDTIFHMYTVLKEEPQPVLLDGKPNGSLRPEDYSWGYDHDTKARYKDLAEQFYQLCCARYSWKNLTPYMIKFINYAHNFMTYLPFPLSRFQTEGGEHLNYVHSSYYFKHTTRHGGNSKVDPQFTLLLAMYRKLAYEIHSGKTGDDFHHYAKMHVSACKIQAVFRGYSVRKHMKERGWCMKPKEEYDVERNHAILQDVHSHIFRTPLKELSLNTCMPLFQNKSFVLSGVVPSSNGRKWTQGSLGEKILSLGGRVKKMLPGNKKGRSTKVYHLLVNRDAIQCSKKMPDIIFEAFKQRCVVLDYIYVFDCIENNCLVPFKSYIPDFGDYLCQTSQQPTLQSQHFSRKKCVQTCQPLGIKNCIL